MTAPRIATYRLQLSPAMGFSAAAEIVADLARMGISHLYLSPVAEAVPGSTHGYDVVDPAIVRGELGGSEGLRELALAARRHGMGVVVDIVPNHVATTVPDANPWWWSVLREGRDAPAASHFDIDWDHADGRVIVPVLGADPAHEIAAGTLRIDGDVVRYHDLRFPLRSGTGTGDDVSARLAEQHYRLQHWRHPDRNVRRFFTIDDLVAIRPEHDTVREAVHRIVVDLDAAGLLDGVRVDHVDGLADPGDYLDELRRTLGDDAWILVEKIVVGDETLPPAWPVDGTTGYEWITLVDHLFTHPAAESAVTDRWVRISGDPRPYHQVEREAVREVLTAALAPDLDRLSRVVAESAGAHDATLTPDDVRRPLVELTAALGRYRTYLCGGDGTGVEATRIRDAADDAEEHLTPDERSALRVVVDVLTSGGAATDRWQQLTGPALAKGGEDRALYRSLRLAAHNEVGGDPGRWSAGVDEFHAFASRTASSHPTTLLAGSTHDTKRSEDVRARLLALTEAPDRWFALDDRVADRLGPAVDPVARHLAVQTAIGAWPIDRDRLGHYLVKAAREADVATSWTAPDPDHESMLRDLAGALTAPPMSDAIAAFVDQLAPAARAVSAAQLVLRLTAPGVPDVYQGGEGPLLTLVDPDNRGVLDPAVLMARVAGLRPAGTVWGGPDEKTAILARVLATRRRHPDCFAPTAGYRPLVAEGEHADHVVAFSRHASGADGDAVAVVVARFPASRPHGWGDTTVVLGPTVGHDVLGDRAVATEGPVPLSELLGSWPAAVVVRSGA